MNKTYSSDVKVFIDGNQVIPARVEYADGLDLSATQEMSWPRPNRAQRRAAMRAARKNRAFT